MPAQFPNSDPASATPQATPFDTILAQCRDLVCERLCQAMSGMLDQVDAALGALIGETRDASTQKLYAQTRDKALAQRQTIEKQFRARYLREFQQRSNRVKKIGDSFSDIDLSSLELELVGDEDLDESLKFNAMAAKLRQYCDEELIALDQRVGVLLGDASLQAEDNPFTPQAICDAYKDTCRQIDANVEVRMVMLRLFDDYVADEIRAVYKAVNALLVQNSILPKIRIQARKDASKPPVRPPAELSKAAAPAEQKPADGEQDLFSILKSLRAGAQPPAGGGAGAGIAAGAAGMAGVAGVSGVPGAPGGVPTMLQGSELLGMLTRIQLGDPGAMPANLVPAVAPGVDPGLANVLHGLKASSVGAGMNQLDMLTLDIMSLVFDQLFDDPKIPVGVKGLIGRLQIPMLKVAIADKTFFSKKTHPARQLLDALGEMSLRLPADFNAANPLFGRMEVVLQEVIDGFEDKMEIFDVARGRLEALIAEEDQRVEQETKTAATRVEQKEKLALAKTVAQAEIKMRARVSEVPREVMEFLAQQWVQLLLIVHVTEGEDSEAWKTALETMDLLIWSVEPKDSAEERRDLVAVVPELLKGVAAGLRAASVDDAVRNSFFAELRKLHDEVLGKAEADAGAAPQEQETDRDGIGAKTEAVAAEPVASTPEPAATLPPVMSQAADSAAAPAPAPAVEATGALESETAAAPAVPAVPESAAEPVAEAVSLPAPDAAPPSDAKPASPPGLELTPAADVATPPIPAAEPAPVPGSEKTAEPVAKTEAIPGLDFAPVAVGTTPTVPDAEGAPAPGIEKPAEPVAKTAAIPDLDFAPAAAAATPPVPDAEDAPAPGIEKPAEPVAKTAAIPELDFVPVAAVATASGPATQSIPAPGIEKATEPVAKKTGGEPDLDFVLPPAAQKSPASEAAFLPDLEFTPAAAPAPIAEPTPPQVAAPAFVLDLELPSASATPVPTPKPAALPDLELSPVPAAEPVSASTPAAKPGAEFVSLPELNFTPAPATPPAPAATAAPEPAPGAEPEFKLELKRVVNPAPAATPAPMQPATAPVAKPGAAPAARPPISPAAPPAQRASAPAPHPAAPPARQPATAAATKPATSAAQSVQRPAVPAANPAAVPVKQPAAGSAPAARMPPTAAQRAAVPGVKPGVAPTAARTTAPATPAARPTAAAGVRPPTRPIARPASMPPASARAQPPRAESKVSDSLDFTAPVTIENPFGGGKVEVEDLDFTAKPAAGTAVARQATAAALPPGLAIGTWVGIRGKDEKEPRKSAKLSFISPLKTRYLFVDKQGKTTLDCTRADLARRFQIGEVIIMDKVPDVPLFDRITEGLVGKLGGKAAR